MKARALSITSAAVTAIGLACAPSALAAGGVFGGSASDQHAIVVNSDAKAKRLTSAVIAWRAQCDDGMGFPVAMQLTATKQQAGFTAGPRDLVMSRNAKGRFAGTQRVGFDLGDSAALATVKLAGKLGRAAASGTLSADITIIDKRSGARQEGCRTGALRWTASRSAGRIYGGKTSQEQPFVIRLDARRKRVSDLLTGWETSSCSPDANRYMTFPERFDNFPLSGGRFGNAFDQDYDLDPGAKRRFSYQLAGKVGRASAKGTFRVGVTDTDASGATTETCDTGPVTWKAITG
jgi:hypothetical protein